MIAEKVKKLRNVRERKKAETSDPEGNKRKTLDNESVCNRYNALIFNRQSTKYIDEDLNVLFVSILPLYSPQRFDG